MEEVAGDDYGFRLLSLITTAVIVRVLSYRILVDFS